MKKRANWNKTKLGCVKATRPAALEFWSAAIAHYFATNLECERGFGHRQKNALAEAKLFAPFGITRRPARTRDELQLQDSLLAENENRELATQIRGHEEIVRLGIESHGLRTWVGSDIFKKRIVVGGILMEDRNGSTTC